MPRGFIYLTDLYFSIQCQLNNCICFMYLTIITKLKKFDIYFFIFISDIFNLYLLKIAEVTGVVGELDLF